MSQELDLTETADDQDRAQTDPQDDADIDSGIETPTRNPFEARDLSDLRTRQLMMPMHEDIAGHIATGPYTLVKRYWVRAPFASIAILRNEANNAYEYHIVEPELQDDERHLRREVESQLRDRVLYRTRVDEDVDREALIDRQARDLIDRLTQNLEEFRVERILYYLKRDLIRWERIDPLMLDNELEGVSCDGVDVPLFAYHRDFEDHMKVNKAFDDEDRLNEFVSKLAQRSGKDISSANPQQGTDLPDGSRVQLTRKEVAPRGANFTIRFFRDDPFTPVDLIKGGTADAKMMAYLWLLVENGHHGLVVGGTSSGKTTFLNAVSMFIPPGKKVVSVEDTRELQLPQDNWVSLVTRESFSGDEVEVSEHDLLEATLRHDPDYIPVGELRGDEASMMFQAASTGHTSYATLHADSMETVLNRLRNKPMEINDPQIGELGFVTVQTMSKHPQTGEPIRRTKEIREVIGVEDAGNDETEIKHRPVFRWDTIADEHEYRYTSSHLQQLSQEGIDVEDEWGRRMKVLNYLLENDIRRYGPVTSVIQSYMRRPEDVITDIDNDDLDVTGLGED